MWTNLKSYLTIGILFSVTGFCFAQTYNSLLVSEIMADPTPVVGLPDAEYIELYNRSSLPVSLKNWKLVMGARSAIFPDSTLLPAHYVIVCNRTNEAALKNYGNVIPLGTFSLANEGSTVSIYNGNGQLMFSVSYTLDWWEVGKRNGGYAIEMIDSDNPCGEKNNWQTSKNEIGGTPGKLNSVKGVNTDYTSPEIQRIDVVSGNELRMVANKKLDSLNAVSGSGIEISGRKIISKKLESPQFKNLSLTLDSPFLPNEKYAVSIKNLSDCSGNILRQADFSIGIPSKSDSGDVVLNEILFNPYENGVDFVEIYNTSDKFVNLKNWSIGNTKNGLPDIYRPITTENLVLSPFTCLALTTDPENIEQNYPSDKQRSFFQVETLPSFPNTSGGVVLKDDTGNVLDQFNYSEDMQDPLINNFKGVSLEKSDAFVSSNLAENWHSAASATGNATPGYANSQVKSLTNENMFFVEPEAFVPNSNGIDDFAKITYKLSAIGETATMSVYDLAGRRIKNLLKNQLIGTSGEIRWDGTDENGTVADTGYYLILVDTFNLNGQIRQFKLKVVVVKK